MYVIYGRPGCRWCREAIWIADLAGVSYEYIDIAEDPLSKQFILSEGHKTVPQVYFTPDGETLQHVGGFQDFKTELTDTDPKEDVPENGIQHD